LAELEVLFAKPPVAVAKEPAGNFTTTRVEITGSTVKAGYVYCWVEKTGEIRVKNETTGNVTNQTTTGKVDNGFVQTQSLVTESAASDPVQELNKENKIATLFQRKYHVKRFETNATTLDFTLSFVVNGGRKYGWGCQATSLNPGDPKFKTDPVTGSVVTEYVIDTFGGSALGLTF